MFSQTLLKIISAIPGSVEASLTIRPEGINRGKTLHGGAICSITDTMGSLALSSTGLHSSGVSTDIGATFVRAAGKEGDTIKILSTVLSKGRSLGFTKVELRDSSNRVVAFGHHTKFIGRSSNPELDVRFSSDGESVVAGSEK
ncbi:HGG motif-containing thioesterase [Phaffia rhodozyma]|uniref:HGG motif-containing thioesterase n=1 Tax=Phaffia rhodozyma TaxID=264483 RepID=A0A0F7SNL0_PHARH|nr:HGG motif-containing thioesterase [Phaffia rhodozyma]